MNGTSRRLLVGTGFLLLAVGTLYFVEGPAPSVVPGPLLLSDPTSPSHAGATAGLEAAPKSTDDPRQPVAPTDGVQDTVQERAAPANVRRAVLSKAGSAVASGRLRVRAIDAVDGEVLDPIRVRVVSGTRIADRRSDRRSAAVDLVLSPDTYSVVVVSKGYEWSEEVQVSIAAGGTVALDPISLAAGSARILGIVTGERAPDGEVRVELRGEGRRPCADCGVAPESDGTGRTLPSDPWTRTTPCPHCGYAAASSRGQLAANGLFHFEDLASGSYAVRLVDAQDHAVGLPKFVDLRAAETLPVELEFAGFRTVVADVIDTDGKSLSTEWAARMRDSNREDAEEFVEFIPDEPVPSTHIQCTLLVGEFCLAQAAFSPPALPGRRGADVKAFGGRRLGLGAPKGVDDRRRMRSEELLPPARPPEVGPSAIPTQLDADGLVRFERLPSLALSLEMTCGPFTAAAAVPPSRTTTRVQVQWSRKADPPSGDEDDRTRSGATFLEFEAGRRN